MKQECVLSKKISPTVRWRRTHGAGEEGLRVELGLPSANRALTFLFRTVVAVAVRRTKVPRCSLRRGSGARAALHPGPLATKARGELLQKYIKLWC